MIRLLVKTVAISLLTAALAHAEQPIKLTEKEEIMALVEEMLEAASVEVQPLNDKDDAKAMVKQVMALVGNGQWVEALVAMQPYLQATLAEYEELITNRYYADIANKYNHGDLIGTELSQIQEMGSSLVMVDYIEKYARHMIRWRFYLYKADEEWIISSVEFEHRLDNIYTGT